MRNYPPTVNSPAEADFARTVMAGIVGADQVLEQQPTMGAEDFSYMLQAKPGAYCFISNGDGDHRAIGHGGGPCTLHNPSYDFNDDLIPLGATYWVRAGRPLAGHAAPRLIAIHPFPTLEDTGSTMDIQSAFSTDYASARTKFLKAASAAGLEVHAYEHPLKGRDGETLAMDVVLDGPTDAERVFIVSSGCHGVEGFCGSGVQVFALHDAEWRDWAHAHGVAVLYLHALNPYGFSHTRRATHENVDLNRNFQDFSQPLPVNAPYAEIHDLLLPEVWPPDAENQAAVDAYIARHGLGKYQAAVTRGQHAYADGMFFGGTGPTWSNQTLRQVLREHAGAARHIAWMDLHTGLGPSGLGERIFACRDDADALQRARAWWGGGGKTPVTSFYDGSSSSAHLTGLMWNVVYEECPQAQYTGIAMEYGTLPVVEMLASLRAEHWLHKHPEASPALRASIKQDMMDAFYVDTDAWREQIVLQATEAMHQAAAGLAAS